MSRLHLGALHHRGWTVRFSLSLFFLCSLFRLPLSLLLVVLAPKKLCLSGLSVFLRGIIDGSLSLLLVLLASRKLSLFLLYSLVRAAQ
jgi:hypothetical protein